MRRQKVTSSTISTVGYDATEQTLEIEFSNGAVYRYYGVPAALYRELLQQESKGQFLNTHIRSAYRFTKVW